MAQPTTKRFSQFKILVGNGETPEVFDIICGLTSKGIQRTASTTSTVVPDCEDEDKPGYEETDVASIKSTISGSGVLARENHERMLQWFYKGERRNVRVQNAGAASGDTEFEQAPAVLTTYSETGESKGKINVDIAIEFSEKPTLVAAA